MGNVGCKHNKKGGVMFQRYRGGNYGRRDNDNPAMRQMKRFANRIMLFSGFFYLLTLDQRHGGGTSMLRDLSRVGLLVGILGRIYLECMEISDYIYDLFRQRPDPGSDSGPAFR